MDINETDSVSKLELIQEQFLTSLVTKFLCKFKGESERGLYSVTDVDKDSCTHLFPLQFGSVHS